MYVLMKERGGGIWVKRFEQFAGAASYVGGVTGVAPLVVRCRQFMSLPNSLLGLPSFVDRHTCNMSLSLPLSAFIDLSRVSSVLHSESTPSVKLIRGGADGDRAE